MSFLRQFFTVFVGFVSAIVVVAPALAQAPAKQPNIIVIMGDDIGWPISAPTTAA